MSQEQLQSNEQWWIQENNESTGPYSAGYIAASLRSGLVSPDQQIRLADSDWKAIQDWGQFKEFEPSERVQTNTHSQFETFRPIEQKTALGAVFTPQRVVLLVAVYGMIINPLVWFLCTISSFGSGFTFSEGTDAHGCEALLKLFVLCIGFTQSAVWFGAGFLVNRLDSRGLWLSIGLGVSTWMGYAVMTALIIGLHVAFPSSQHRVPQANEAAGEAIMTMFDITLTFADLALQTMIMVWMWIRRHSISWNTAR